MHHKTSSTGTKIDLHRMFYESTEERTDKCNLLNIVLKIKIQFQKINQLSNNNINMKSFLNIQLAILQRNNLRRDAL